MDATVYVMRMMRCVGQLLGGAELMLSIAKQLC